MSHDHHFPSSDVRWRQLTCLNFKELREMLQIPGTLRAINCFLSIGTGIPQVMALPNVRYPIQLATDITDITANSSIITSRSTPKRRRRTARLG